MAAGIYNIRTDRVISYLTYLLDNGYCFEVKHFGNYSVVSCDYAADVPPSEWQITVINNI